MKANMVRHFLVAGAVLAAMFSSPFSAQAQPPLQVKTASGVVEGKEAGPVHAYLGIPYAAPPVGDLRWKPPMPPAKWDGIRKATEFGSHCMQGDVYGDMVFPDPGNSEDCLSLNVWVPANPSQGRLPVMVWIYGGGFMAGGTSEPRQHGEILAQQGVIVVSMNYRLGIFGFLVHPELAKESGHNSAGNYGLLDQLAALQWVHHNIAAFGGDPKNVTIFGESAGSFSVSAQMASPLAKGLFQKAIGESGAAFGVSGLLFEPLAAREEKDVKDIKAKLGVSTLAELRAIPAEKLLEVYGKPGPDGFRFGPDVDGHFLPESVPAIFAAGKRNKVALLAGWNHDEVGVSQVPADKSAIDALKATADKEFSAKAADFLKLYPGDSEAQARRSLADFGADHFLGFATWRWLEAQTKTGKRPVYRYRFDLPFPTDPKEPPKGAYHSAEIEYVFGQLDSKAGVPWRTVDRELSAQMQKYWANFARAGDPNGPGLPNWPAYSSKDGWPVMLLNAQSMAHKDELRERYLFLVQEWVK